MTDRELEHAKELAALGAKLEARDMEIRDLKKAMEATNRSVDNLTAEVAALRLQVQPMLRSAEKLEKLLSEADRQDGMKSLAQQVVGWGALGAFGAALVGIYRYFMGGGM